MKVKPCDNFCNNDSKSSVVVTYEINNTGSGTLIVDDGNGHELCKVDSGKKEDHIFTVPPGGKLHCGFGEGECTFKATTVVALQHNEKLLVFATDVLKLARKFQEQDTVG